MSMGRQVLSGNFPMLNACCAALFRRHVLNTHCRLSRADVLRRKASCCHEVLAVSHILQMYQSHQISAGTM